MGQTRFEVDGVEQGIWIRIIHNGLSKMRINLAIKFGNMGEMIIGTMALTFSSSSSTSDFDEAQYFYYHTAKRLFPL